MKKQLSKSDVEKINDEIKQQFNIDEFFKKKDRVSLAEVSHELFVLKDDVLSFFYRDGRLVPSLKSDLSFLKKVVVDMGAVKFVCSGADVMRPGIVELDHSISNGEVIVVVDQTHKKPLCIAQALFSGEEIFNLKQGRVLKNLHWVGDDKWQVVP